MKIRGTIVHEKLEGGFWGIVGDDGENYMPVDELPKRLRSDGIRVEADLEPVEAVSFAMWGRSVRVRDIRPL